PSKYLWRAICQYRCQCTARKKSARFAANVAAFACLPLIPLFIRRAKRQNKTACRYLKVNFHMAYKIPAMIRDCTVEKNMAGTYLTWNDFTFAISLFLKNGAFYPELLLKFIRWIAFIRPYIDLYQPEYIIQYCEFSRYSSLRKLFLKRHNIKI